MKTTVAVIFGCASVEHEVSIISAVQAMQSINRNKYQVIPVYITKKGEMFTGENLFKIDTYKNIDEVYKNSHPITFVNLGGKVVIRFLDNKLFKKNDDIEINVAFPIVHGTNCEDGSVAGFLELLGLPYVGCDVLSAAIGMDKAKFKTILTEKGLPVLPCIKFSAREWAEDKDKIIENINKSLKFPLIVKPVNLGSSVGITKVNAIEELDDAITLALSFADRILVEHAVSAIREINCSVLGDTDSCTASVCEEPFMNDEILSYEDKYMGNSKNGGQSKGMASLGRKIPADLSEEKSKEIRDLACKIFKAIGASGVVRIDFIIDTETDTVYANEINTIPGSLAFYLWEASGIKYPELCDRLIELAFRRQRSRENLTFTIDTNILSGVSFGTKGSKGAKM